MRVKGLKIVSVLPICLALFACKTTTKNESAVQSVSSDFKVPLECSQIDGDDWYRVATTGDKTAVVFTNDSDESRREFLGRTVLSKDGNEINSPSIRIELKNDRGYASLYDVKTNSLLTDVLECQTVSGLDIDTWANNILYPADEFAAMECYQADGDDRYDVKTVNGRTVIIHTNDNDIKSIEYYDISETYPETKTLSAGRFIVNYDKDGYSTLSKKVGNAKQELTSILQCEENYSDIQMWIDLQMK